MQQFYKFPIQTLTVCFAFGIVLEHIIHLSIPFWLTIIIALLGTSIFFTLKKKPTPFKVISFGLLIGFLFINLGVFLKQEANYQNNPIHFSKFVNENKSHFVSGTITSVEKPSAKFRKYLFEINQIDTTYTKGIVFLYLSKKDSLKLIPGDEIVLNNTFFEPTAEPNPFSFDYNKFLSLKNISHVVFCYENQIIKLKTTPTLKNKIFRFKEQVKAQFDAKILSKQTQSIVNALLFGEKSFIDTQLLNDYSKVGIIHILAISGLHIAILYFFISFILKPLRKIKHGRLLIYIITMLTLWGFALLTGFSPSVTRAVAMFSLFGFAKLLHRDSNTYNVLFLSAMLILLFQPNYLFDVGFQLSYAAVFSIVAFQAYFKNFYFTKNKIINYFIDIVLVSFAAQIGVLPISLYYFHQFPLAFFIANLFVIPLISLLLILSLLNCFTYFLPKVFATILCQLIEWISELMNYGIQLLAKLKFVSIDNIPFNHWQLIFSFLLILLLLKWLRVKKLKTYIFLLICGIMLIGTTYIAYKNGSQNSEIVIFDSNELLIAIKEKEKIVFFSDSLTESTKIITRDYIRGNFNTSFSQKPVSNLIVVADVHFKIITNSVIIPNDNANTILILEDNPKVNLEQILAQEKPKLVIFTANNYKSSIDLWKKTCLKQKIPFHAISEKGFYSFKLN